MLVKKLMVKIANPITQVLLRDCGNQLKGSSKMIPQSKSLVNMIPFSSTHYC